MKYDLPEKIKIYLPQSTENTLLADAKSFEFRKKDGNINKSLFVNTLIANYYQQYEIRRRRTIKSTQQTLCSAGGNYNYEFCAYLVDTIIHRQNTQEHKKRHKNAKLNLSVGVKSRAYDYIQEIKNTDRDISLSHYLGNMIKAYCSVPRYERERIIFSDATDIILESISNEKMISFKSTSDTNGQTHHVSPYALVPGEGQLNNYLLCYDADLKRVMTFRLSRLQTVYYMDRDCFISDIDRKKLDSMKQFAPQFSFEDAEMICVRFTDKGLESFQKIYTNRPAIDHIDPDDSHVYWFYWSHWGAFQYFKRFGEDTVILQPESLQRELKDWYKAAFQSYTPVR